MGVVWLALYRRVLPANSSSLVFLFFLLDFVSSLFSIVRFISFPSDLGHSVVREHHRCALPSIFLGPKPHGLALVVEYGVEPAVVGGFPRKFLFCFSVFFLRYRVAS
jgi:hypothetical protein